MDQAIILAAGRGSRLGAATDGTPKCMIDVGGSTLLDHQIRALRDVGIKRICVVTGHESDQVRASLDSVCDCLVNASFAETNSLYSLWLTRGCLSGGFMLLNCDVLAHPEVYRRVAEAQGCALAYDSSSGADPEHMKLQIVDGRLVTMSKTMDREIVCGENVGILKFDAQGAQHLYREAHRLITTGVRSIWAPAALDGIARQINVSCIDIADLPWVEIDFAEDYAQAQRRVWPAIARTVLRSNYHPSWRLQPRTGWDDSTSRSNEPVTDLEATS